MPVAVRLPLVPEPVPPTEAVELPGGLVLLAEREAPLAVTKNGSPLEVPEAETTVTCAVVAEVRSLAGTLAVSCVEDTTVVGNAAPFHCTVEPAPKLVPVTLTVVPALPA